MAIVECK